MSATSLFIRPRQIRFGQTFVLVAALVLGLLGAQGALAQVTKVDPDKAIDGDLSAAPGAAKAAVAASATPTTAPSATPPAAATAGADIANQAGANPASTGMPAPPAVQPAPGGTYKEDDLIGAAEGVFGKGAKGLAGLIKNLLKKQGEPNAYIVGREGSGAIGVGLRYGSGTLYHKVEGQRAAYWTGPSIGFDAGANAGNSFVLVYNLYNTDDLYHRFVAGEGGAYVFGGFTASYMRRGDIVLIPIRAGVGMRLGVNAGYLKFSTKHKWIPF